MSTVPSFVRIDRGTARWHRIAVIEGIDTPEASGTWYRSRCGKLFGYRYVNCEVSSRWPAGKLCDACEDAVP